MIAERYLDGAAYLAACREAFRVTAEGGKVRTGWAAPYLDADGWRAEFRAALDRRITARMAPSYSGRACRCRHCTARCDCGTIAPSELRRVPVPIVTLCGRCTRGKRADADHERALFQDQNDLHDRVRRRVRVYQFRTPEVRARFAHLLVNREED